MTAVTPTVQMGIWRISVVSQAAEMPVSSWRTFHPTVSRRKCEMADFPVDQKSLNNLVADPLDR